MAREYGVKRSCLLSDSLEHFHVVNGFPPDLLLEGIVPFELALCLKALVAKGYFSLLNLNMAIKPFPYSFSDKTNQPQVIGKTFASKGTIGGNGHGNWALLRLLPLLIGHLIPEGDETWEVLMHLKDVVELSLSVGFRRSLCTFCSAKFQNTEVHFKECSLTKNYDLSTTMWNITLGTLRCLGLCLMCGQCALRGNTSFSKKRSVTPTTSRT